ncbi:MAG: serine/threonine protein kinase, partial [Candidatus Dormibacteria bacterium]
ELRRMLSILKVRDSFYDPSLLEVVIHENGVDLKKASRNALAVPGSAPP